MSNENINAFLIEKAFELGRWRGQVDLEEHYDYEQYSSSAIEQIFSQKMSMPQYPELRCREVIIKLRSDKWRKGVKETTKKELHKILERLS